jgi:hypothetical protein
MAENDGAERKSRWPGEPVSEMAVALKVSRLAPDEPLSPELVLVLPPELRAQVLASLGPPHRPAPEQMRSAAPAAPVREPLARSLGMLVVTRTAQLGMIFATVAMLVLAMSLVAHAFR